MVQNAVCWVMRRDSLENVACAALGTGGVGETYAVDISFGIHGTVTTATALQVTLTLGTNFRGPEH
jgi:hypothetical protein